MDGCVVRLHSVSFYPGAEGTREAFSAHPIRVNFHQLLQARDAPVLLHKVENGDVLRAVVALLDSSLPDIGSQDIHDTVHSPGTHTIILLRDHADVLEEYRVRAHPNWQRKPVSPESDASSQNHQNISDKLSELFSESEESSEENSVTEYNPNRCAWENFCEGLEEFLAGARKRREMREAVGEDGDIPPSAVGVECLLIAAAAYERKALMSGETVLQLSLLATRKQYRQCGVGRYIIELLKTQSICGEYNALLAHADADAIDFFTRCEFTDDPLLNDKFKELRDDWTNITLMSYLPPFTTELKRGNPVFLLNLTELESEVDLARTNALSAYQQQAVCVARLVQEVKTLRDQLKLQREQVELIQDELEHEKQKRYKTEQMFLEYKFQKTWQLLERKELETDEEVQTESLTASPDEAQTIHSV